MKKQPQVIIIHGSYGNPEENWFPWLSKELDLRNIKNMRPKLPTPEGQNLENWKSYFSRQVHNLTSETIIVGHSLAPAFIFHILQNNSIPIKATFLVSPFVRELGLPDFDRVNRSFIKGPFRWEKIKRMAGKVFIFGGDNDPYVPLDAMREVADNLSCQLTLIKNGGHLNAEAGYTSFPQLRDSLIKIVL